MERQLTFLINRYGTFAQVPVRLLLSFRYKDLSKLPNQYKKLVQQTMKKLLTYKEVSKKKEKLHKLRNRERFIKSNDNSDFYQQSKDYAYLAESEMIAQNEYNKNKQLERQQENALERYWEKKEKREREAEYYYRIQQARYEREQCEMIQRERKYEQYKKSLKLHYKQRNELSTRLATLTQEQEDIEYQIAICNSNIRNNPLYAY